MRQSRGWSHEAVFEAEPLSASRARDFVGTHLREHGLWQLADDVGLVATELVTNALRHAGTGCRVRLKAAEGSLVLAVEDGSARLPVPRNPGPLDVGGRGLLLVDVLSRDWGIEKESSDTKRVWASFPMPP